MAAPGLGLVMHKQRGFGGGASHLSCFLGSGVRGDFGGIYSVMAGPELC